jgi:hypothetical protein
MPTFHPWAKKRENHFRAKTGATEAVFSRRRAKTHQCGAMRFPNMGNLQGLSVQRSASQEVVF